MNEAFTQYFAKKEKLGKLVQTAFKYQIIDEQFRDDINSKLESDILTIGVIGQVKAGKSTFLNSFIFENDILPVAGSPMTSSLCVIKYGTQKKIVVEFYSKEEWAELLLQSQRDLSEVTKESEKSKVIAAKEIIRNATELEEDLNLSDYLGEKKEDDLNQLADYVGRDGKFLPITKLVTIYYPNDNLKGVEIVDTPGFNDPIESREIKTKEFLKNADAVILILYAGQAFTSEDYDILFNHVRFCGIGKVLIGVNKYDIPYRTGSSIEDIKTRVVEEIHKGCESCSDQSLNYILKNCEPVLFSAQMALLSELPMETIQASNELSFYWNQFSKSFEIGSSGDFRRMSNIEVLIEKVKDVIEKEKGEIMLKSPTNAIMSKANQKLLDIQAEINALNNKISLLSIPDTEFTSKLRNAQNGLRRMTVCLGTIDLSLQDKCEEIERSAKRKLRRCIDTTCANLRHIINNWGVLEDVDVIGPRIVSEINRMQYLELKQCSEDFSYEAKQDIKNEIDTLFQSLNSIGMEYLPDFNLDEHLVNVKTCISMKIDNDLFTKVDEDSEESVFSKILDVLNDILKFINPLGNALVDAVFHNRFKKGYEELVNNLALIDTDVYTYMLTESTTSILAMVNTYCKEKMIEPITNTISVLRTQATNRDEELLRAQEIKKQKKIELDTITQQLNKLKILVMR